MDRTPRYTDMDCPPESERISVLLSKLFERKILGTREIISCRRRFVLGLDYILTTDHVKILLTGSWSEGVSLPNSDVDLMGVDKNVTVVYPGDSIPPDSTQKTLPYAAKADCRPGFVTLKLGHKGRRMDGALAHSLVPVGNVLFLSSDMYREYNVKINTIVLGHQLISNGPSSSLGKNDIVACFHMSRWPREANQWVTRPRFYGWPSQATIDKIMQSGCHVVPVGDKCSNDTLLQWRLSFASAERLLVHSFSHTQMKVYFLLKYFLQQMKPTLQNILGKEDEDILCSYHLKTVMFHSVENSHPKLWQEQNLLYCFWFCFNILISCVRAGHFPQYFIPTINLFERKVHGQNQHKLVHILDSFHAKKLLCLWNVQGLPCCMNMLEHVSHPKVQASLMRAQSVQETEYTQDMFVKEMFAQKFGMGVIYEQSCLSRSVDFLMNSHTELDEVVSFLQTVCLVSAVAKEEAHQNLTAGRLTNKTRYQTLRKCQHRLTLCASMGTYSLELATLCFLTGTYSKALQICQRIISQPSYYSFTDIFLSSEEEKMYMKQYCGKGYTTIDKLRKTLTHNMCFYKGRLHLPHLHLEVSRNLITGVCIPPLPYALFLSFLCCHELRDRRGRDEALCNMAKLVHSHETLRMYWIVHTMLGICYETIGDYTRAIRAYLDSAYAPVKAIERNPAQERIDALLRCVTK